MSIRYLFNTAGNYVAFQQGSNVFRPDTNWLGFVISGNQLYSSKGIFLGYILADDRIAKQQNEPARVQIVPPIPPLKPVKPLKPLKRLKYLALPYPYKDVFDEGVKGLDPGLLSFGMASSYPLNDLLDSELWAADDTFLGAVNKNAFNIDSLSNQFGTYGNPYNATTIFNQFSPYGNPYSELSPYNQFSRTPPRFQRDGSIIAYLTANKFIGPRVDPAKFRSWLRQ